MRDSPKRLMREITNVGGMDLGYSSSGGFTHPGLIGVSTALGITGQVESVAGELLSSASNIVNTVSETLGISQTLETVNQLGNTLSTTLTGNMASDLSNALESVGLDSVLGGMAEAPLSAATGLAISIASGLAIFRRKEDEDDGELGTGNGDSDTQTSTDSSGLSSNFSEVDESGTVASSPMGEDYFPPESIEGVNYGIKPVLTNTESLSSSNDKQPDKADRGEADDKVDEAYINLEHNKELLRQYYFATTKEKAAELLAIFSKKDPANAANYYKTLADAMKKWESMSVEQRIKELEKPAEEIFAGRNPEKTQFALGEEEPSVEQVAGKIVEPEYVSLLDRNLAMIQSVYYSTNHKDTQLFVERLKHSDSNLENQEKYDTLLKSLEKEKASINKVPNLKSTFKNAGLEYTNITKYETDKLKFNQFDEQRKSALFDNFIRRQKLEDEVYQKEKRVKELEKEGEIISLTLKATTFNFSELNDDQKRLGAVRLEDKTKIEEFQKSTIDSLNSLSDSYFFAIKDGSIVVKELKGVTETKPLAAELIRKNFIERETIDGGIHKLEFTYGEKKDGKPNGGWTYEPFKDLKSSTIQLHPNIPAYQPVTSHENIKEGKVQDKDQIIFEYTDHNITLAHELIHSLKDLNGTHIEVKRSDFQFREETYPGKLVIKANIIVELVKRRNDIIGMVGLKGLTQTDIENARKNLLEEGNKINDDSIREEIISQYNSTIGRLLIGFKTTIMNEDFYLHEGFDPETGQLIKVPVYKEEAITTWGIENLTDMDGNPPSATELLKHKSEISDNSLREEMGLPARLNYIISPDNIYYYSSALKLVGISNNWDEIKNGVIKIPDDLLDSRFSRQVTVSKEMSVW